MEDKMMKNYLRKRCQLLVMLLVVFVFTLTACGSKQETTAIKEIEAVAVEEAVAETVVEETVIEESVREIYIPEGIDMESTLSGEEWIASFVGNVNEPVVVIFNDNNGRKEVVQADSEVIINPDEDRIAAYWTEQNMYSEPYNISVKETYSFYNYEIRVLAAERLRCIPERQAKMTVKGGPKDWVLEFTIIVE